MRFKALHKKENKLDKDKVDEKDEECNIIKPTDV